MICTHPEDEKRFAREDGELIAWCDLCGSALDVPDWAQDMDVYLTDDGELAYYDAPDNITDVMSFEEL